MNIKKGNIWEFHKDNAFVVVPTNMGFTKNKYNVMGAGVAEQAKDKFPDLPLWYGNILLKRLKNKDSKNIVFDNSNKLILFPTKKLNVETPHLSWKQNSDLETIEKSCQELSYIALFKKDYLIFMPLVGCGNGGLDKRDVLPILEKYFGEINNVFLVEQ